MSEAQELKACPNPWCSEKQNMARVRDVPKPTFRVICKCGVMGPMALTEAKAITAWNTRPTEDRLVGALEEAERALEVLVATVQGECPSLLNEDSGGNASLSEQVDAALTRIRAAKGGE